MSEWTITKSEHFDRNGDYEVHNDKGFLVMLDTSYYPVAPEYDEAEFIVKAVNYYLAHLPQEDVAGEGEMDE